MFSSYSDVLAEYCEKMHDMGKVLLEGISESLGLDPKHINKLMDIESSQQLWAANRYPPCPDQESVMGIPAHTDYGLLTLLTQHGTNGLEIFHEDKWMQVHPIKGAILANTCDHIEVNIFFTIAIPFIDYEKAPNVSSFVHAIDNNEREVQEHPTQGEGKHGEDEDLHRLVDRAIGGHVCKPDGGVARAGERRGEVYGDEV